MRRPMSPEQAASDDSAKEAALRILARGPRTEREVMDRLIERGYVPDAVERAVERLRRVSLLDDRAYLAWFVRAELGRKPQALRLIETKLARHGLPRPLVAAAEEAIRADGDLAERALDTEEGRAEAAAREVGKKLARRGPEERRRLLQSALLRRGFSWDTIRDLVSERSHPES
ncbi:MAG TPA: regulatory protein RecX [Candidatus Eisenbacteria bacterium]|nr:regulatory protein RecX [Candidatus Eisenbacteria bacterium]